MRHVIVIAVLAVCSLLGCATSFVGEAHVEGGRAGCESKCTKQGMRMAGMVYMGEYSDACICEMPRAAGEAPRSTLLASGGAGGGAVGVVMQMQAQRSQQAASMQRR